MSDRILTTHAGSLPRPDELADMIWARLDGQEVDETALQEQIEAGVTDVVAKQRAAGIDLISGTESSPKTGFSTYVNERFSGFDGRSEFQADDVADFPNLAMRLFNTPSMGHIVFSNCVGPVALSDKHAVHHDVDRLKRAAGRRRSRRPRSWARSAPARSRSTTPTSTTDPTRRTSARLPTRCPTSTGRLPTRASASRSTPRTWRWPPTAGRSAAAWATGTITSRSPSTRSTPRSRGSRPSGFACTCAGAITPAPTIRTSPSTRSSGRPCGSMPARSTSRAPNPRHAHEWRVFQDVELPDDKSVILGVIDVKVQLRRASAAGGRPAGRARPDRRQGAGDRLAPIPHPTRSSGSRKSIPTWPG